MVIPLPLRALLNRQREVRRTLKTDSYRLAQKRARQYAARYEAAFDRVMIVVKRDDLGFTEQDWQEIMGLFPDFSDPKDQDQPAEPILSNEEIEARLRRREVERLLTGAYGRRIPEKLESLAEQLLELSQPYLATQLRTVLPKLRDELVLRNLGSVREVGDDRDTQTASGHDPLMSDWTLYQVWQHQLDCDRADPSSKGGQANHGGTLAERERRARVMTVLTQHKPVRSLTKNDWQAAYNAARLIKAGAVASIDPPTPLSELLTDNREEMAGHERVSSLISSMKQIQAHARFLDLTTIRTEDLKIKPVEKRSTHRTRGGRAFTADDVEAIFRGFIYRGAPPKDKTKAYPFWFWLPLVGYFTGARTNEIAQLDTADIRVVENCPCFEFCPDPPDTFEAKRIKTGEARLVPIHPRLIELGFLAYVEGQRESKQKKLFGDGLTYLAPRQGQTDHNKEGWAKSASKFFNEAPRGYLVQIGIHEPNDGKSLYSFRHTLETNLSNARRNGEPLDRSIIDAITGHLPQTIAGKHYDEGATVHQKLNALLLLPMPTAIQSLTSYQVDFVDRFGNVLTKSIQGHRRKHARLASL